jgi:4-hydroxybenzoate polyprenyltransferase
MVARALETFGSQLRPLLGFSRVVQAMLSVAQPFFAAIVAMHGFPSADRLLLGLSAAGAGFLAVFALNDLMDVEVDRARFSHLREYESFDIDSVLSRHPLAQRQISRSVGLAWIGGLAAYALTAAYLLNPAAAVLFIAAALLELLYCKLARVSAVRFLVNGLMVGVGSLAGWLAMTGEVRPGEMIVLFLWMFAWEIGGRNIVNDFADLEEDVRLGIKTVPVVFGPRIAAQLVLGFLLTANVAALALQLLSGLSLAYLAGAAGAGLYLLLWPGIRLLQSPLPQNAMALFNRASLYPPAMLLVLVASLYMPLP